MSAESTDELREALEEALWGANARTRPSADRLADALLAGPLAPLLAKVRAVEALTEELSNAKPWIYSEPWAKGYAAGRLDAAARIRRALDGPR